MDRVFTRTRYTKHEYGPRHTILTVKLDKDKHSNFKSICILQHKNMQEAYESLIDEFIEKNKDWLPINLEKNQ